jgi:hypothetical protein
MLEKCKAIIQEYIMRMTTDNLVIKWHNYNAHKITASFT